MYKDLTLFGLGLAGVLLHCLIKIYQLKKDKKFKTSAYFSAEWPAMTISLIVVAVAIVCKKEITQLEQAGQWLGVGFVGIGYMGQSLLITVMGKFSSIAGIKDDVVKGLALLCGLTFLCSCANEKKFVSFHDKRPDKAVNYCRAWNPVKDSIHESVFYQPGEPQYIPGETVYINCDSVYGAVLDEAANLGIVKGQEITRLKGLIAKGAKKVAAPCPPSTVTTNTVTVTQYVQIRDTGMEDLLRKQRDEWTARAKGYLTWAQYEGIALGILILLGGVVVYANYKRA